MNCQTIWLSVICSFFLCTVKAQLLPKSAVSAAIGKMSKELKDHYVYPQKGVAIADHLTKSYKAGKFLSASSWKEFADTVTKCLQDYSHDGHLYVRYDTALSRELSKQQSETSKENKVLESNEEKSDPFFYSPSAADRKYGFDSIGITADNIGYIHLSEINISRKSLPTLYKAMTSVAGTRALIIDLRDNGGGGSDTGAVFESFFLPEKTPLITFISRTGERTTDSTVSWLKEKRYDRPVFILINNKTASAAEAFTFAMKRTGRATVIGQPSAGAANMNAWFPINEHIFISVSEMAPVWHGTTETWERQGIQPDCRAVTEGEITSCIQKKIGSSQFKK
ncbi:S41 family peptidase [Chitinophaga sp. S165]|uniref:S41 family peptidase n=1 Tax=Chitinophaga sp. S165 TaxID=2135462 RepID=UPI000D70B24E|nr:S41 family peptidase [Chitinophaga sp. S165]PWV49542.1 peptidase S41-like protein [Chitinophaga sp. S165]